MVGEGCGMSESLRSTSVHRGCELHLLLMLFKINLGGYRGLLHQHQRRRNSREEIKPRSPVSHLLLGKKKTESSHFRY